MPKGVICGGAVDGSNQLGEMVTNHAMTARPDGVAATVGAAATRKMTDASCKRTSARSTRMACDCFMGPSTLHQYLAGSPEKTFCCQRQLHCTATDAGVYSEIIRRRRGPCSPGSAEAPRGRTF